MITASDITHAPADLADWATTVGTVGPKLDELADRTSGLITVTAGRLFGAAVGASSASFLTQAQSYANLGILRAYKSADVTITSDATLNNDADLFLSLAAATRYLVLMFGRLRSHATPDIQWDYTYSGTVESGSPWLMCHVAYSAAGTWSNRLITAFSSTVNAGTVTGADASWLHYGWIETTTAGTLQFRWSQNGSDVNDTTVYKGCTLWAIPVA